MDENRLKGWIGVDGDPLDNFRSCFFPENQEDPDLE